MEALNLLGELLENTITANSSYSPEDKVGHDPDQYLGGGEEHQGGKVAQGDHHEQEAGDKGQNSEGDDQHGEDGEKHDQHQHQQVDDQLRVGEDHHHHHTPHSGRVEEDEGNHNLQHHGGECEVGPQEPLFEGEVVKDVIQHGADKEEQHLHPHQQDDTQHPKHGNTVEDEEDGHPVGDGVHHFNPPPPSPPAP